MFIVYDLFAFLDRAGNVIDNDVAGDEVPLVDAEPEPQAALQLRNQAPPHPGEVVLVVGHEDGNLWIYTLVKRFSSQTVQ